MKRIIWSRFFRHLVPALGMGTSRRAAGTRATRRLTQPVRACASVRPRLESLEDRTLLSSYVVNVGGDALNPNGSPVTGTLRWAVTQADLNPNSTITFDTTTLFGKGNSGTIALANGELPIKVNMTIQGPSDNSIVSISGAGGKVTPTGKTGTNRVFDVTSSAATVTIANLTIEDGNAQPFNTTVAGNQGGNIYNGGNLTLTNDIVENGTSTGDIGGLNGRGGGIYNAEGANGTGATLILNGGTVVKSNTASGAPGFFGGAGEGGGIYNDTYATLIVEDASQIKDNKALGSFGVVGGPGLGGGIYSNTSGKLQIQGNSSSSIVIEDNLAQGEIGVNGAAGQPVGKAPRGPHGSAGSGGGTAGSAQGGGIFNSGSSLTLQYVSILGNQAVGGRGGNGGAGGVGGTGSKTTFGTGGTGGTGGGAGAGGNAEGGGIYNGVGSLSLSHVVFDVGANNLGNDALGGSAGDAATGGVGGKSATIGGAGGIGGQGADGGFAKGGAIANAGGDVSLTDTTFTSSVAKGGNGSSGALAGNGSAGAVATDVGGAGGNGTAGGAGGLAQGGAISNQAGNLSILNSSFAGSQALGGNGGDGGGGGVGGTGGPGSKVAPGGPGGAGGIGANAGAGGSAQGGVFYNFVGTVTINGSSFTANSKGIDNEAISGSGGSGGNGGNGGQGGDDNVNPGANGGPGGAGGIGGDAGNSGFAEGGVGGNQGGSTFVTNSSFTSSLLQSGNGGNGGNGGTGGAGGNAATPPHPYTNGIGGAGGDAGNGGDSEQAFGGVLAVTASNLTVTGSTFGQNGAGNTVIGGNGGAGGIGGTIGTLGHGANQYALIVGVNTGNGGQSGAGASVNGGAIFAADSTLTIQIGGSTFTSNAITGGTGGAGGAGGVFSVNGQFNGFNGQGGAGGQAEGGAMYLASTTAESATLDNDTISASSATGGMGGAGAINNGEGGGTTLPSVYALGMPSPPGTLSAAFVNGFGSNGGAGGSVQGVGLADVNYNSTITNSSFNGGTGVAGVGGAGGGASATEPYTFRGGNAGDGGTIRGGGVFFSNSSSGTLLFNYNGGSASGNTLLGGTGGLGGDAGGSGHSNITGGSGGQAGYAQGGGIYLWASSSSIDNGSLANLTVAGNAITGGTGGAGGSGFNAAGGAGGNVQGGAIFNTSLNTASNQSSSLSLTAITVSGNQATGGDGGNAGSGTTPNGGAGGAGGDAGLADGAGLYNGDNTPLTVINSTFGGSTSSGNASVNYNQLFGGRGGTGGDAGTPTGVPNNNGGAGGAGGDITGGNVYIASDSAAFINDTIVYGQAVATGPGGAGGAGAGIGGQTGPDGKDGSGVAGGYFAASGSSNTMGNTILALNNAVTDPDAAGVFLSDGHNLLSNTAGTSGFKLAPSGTDQLVTAAKLNLGPLMNNGGPTSTDALLNNSSGGESVAIDAGGNTLVTSTYATLFGANPTDQRGTGFPRIYNKKVDVGAFEYQPPVIINLNPPSAVEQGQPFTLTITGTGFVSGATVSWDFNGSLSSYSNLDNLTPVSVSANQITVAMPANALPDEGTVNVTVTVPDGSDIASETLTSSPAVFTITEGSTITLSQPGTQNSDEGDKISVANGNAVQITSSDPDTTFSSTTLPPGLSIDPVTGIITGIIDPRGTGQYTVTVNGIDDGVVRGSTTFTWNVADTTPPAFTNPGTQNSNEGDTIVGLNTYPVDADPKSISATGLPQGLSIDPTTGVISGTIYAYAANSSPYTVTVSATDGTLPNGNPNVGTMTFQWIVADTTAPVLIKPLDQTSNEGASPTLQIETQAGVNDPPDSFSATGLPSGLTINNSGLISGTIGAYATGNYSVSVTATDNGYVSQPINFTWTVLDTTPPSFTIGNQTSNEGHQIPSGGLATSPVDADPGTITDVVNGQHTLPPGLSIDPNTGAITGTIDPYAVTNGQSSQVFNVTLSATDGTLPNGQPNTGTATFTWTVNDTTPPSFTIGNQTNDEGYQIPKAGIATNPVDADPGSITDVSNGQHTLPPGLTIDPTTGIITGTIDSRAAGTYTVKISATDGKGNIGSTTFTWTVNDTTPPSFTILNQINNEGTVLSSLGVSTNPVDADAGSITDVFNGQHTLPPGLTIDPTTGIITGTIGAYAAGTYTVTISATDGTVGGSTTFKWTVNDSTAPSFSIGTQNNNEGDSVSVSAGPTDADAGSITDVVKGQHTLPPGLTIDPNTGLITGTIDPRGTGTYTVTLSATDGKGNVGTNQFAWNVFDTTPPVLTNPGNRVSNEDTAATVAIQAVDADSYGASGLPAGVSMNATTGVISGTVFAPAGTYHVTVSAFDGNAVSQTTFAWVVNQAPVAVAVTNVQNIYVGFYQVETVTAQVTNPSGILVNRGAVTFQVNGETLSADVNNGFATATFITPMLSLDMTILSNDVFTHSLNAAFSDSAGVFGSGGSSVAEPAMFLDYLMYLQALEFGPLGLQLAQLQQH